MNKIILTGRLTKEVQLRKTPKGDSVSNFTLAVARQKRDETDFVDCVAWNKTADFMESWLDKGNRITIVGSLQSRSYDKDDKKITLWYVVVESVEPIDWKEKKETKEERQETRKSTLSQYFNDDDDSDDNKLNITSDDLPF